MIDHLPATLRRVLDWQRRRFFREESWVVTGPAPAAAFVRNIEAETDNGLPLLMTLPKFRFNKPFVGRIRDGQILLKHRTRPIIWPIGPGSYYYTGRLEETESGGLDIQGSYKLRPTLAIMYYAYLTLGFAFLGLSIVALLGGATAWAWLTGIIGPVILLAGLKMLTVSVGYLALGWGHITVEKWLDGRNRHAVRALLNRAAGNA
ncbi:MAG: hypothetical protein OEY16_02850 [Alphaproteobacteria bacterium]|nr:hypothetical protein [Alphaproteobacteria bacterium]